MNYVEDLEHLTYLTFQLIESESGKPNTQASNWKNDGQVLCAKIFKNIASAQQLYNGSHFNFGQGESLEYIDISSIAVLLRTAFESYLTFHYVFINDDPEVTQYCHKAWSLAGLIDRSRLFANTKETKQILAQEAVAIRQIIGELEAHPHHQTHPPKRGRSIIEGKWKPADGWKYLSELAAIHPTYFRDIYNGLSNHAHGSYISILQIRDTPDIYSQKRFAESFLNCGILVLAHLIHSYVELFPESEKVLRESKARDIAFTWYIKTEHVDHIYTPPASQ